ncbi:MarC family protein [Hyphomonas sp.]|uniref:MarC family protein n=1 Tax=Hyphomonas sp. TaxID=87 RepID=UPI0030F9B7F9
MDWEFATKFLGALFAIMNPFLNLPIFLALTNDKTVVQQRAMAIRVAIYSAIMCIAISLAGASIIAFFGVTVDAFRVAGGLVLLGIAFSMLHGRAITSHERGDHEKDDDEAQDEIAFYPMTFPMIVGPGTLVTLIIYAAQATDPSRYIAFAAVLAAVLVVLLGVLYFASSIGKLLSMKMRVVVTRLMGMLLAAISIEMVFQGAKVMLPGLAG